MSSFSLSLKMLLATGALAGLTLTACGSDNTSAGTDNANASTGSTSAKKDAGTAKKDAGTATKDAGAANSSANTAATGFGIAEGAVEGEPCTGVGGHCADDSCDAPPCGTKCTDGFYEECKPASSFLPMGTATGTTGSTSNTGTSAKPDAGSPAKSDGGGSTSGAQDAGSSSTTTSGDAGGAVSSCPAPNTCSDPAKPGVISSMLLSITNQARYCTTGDGTGGSVVCANGVADCVAGGLKNATCTKQFCIQLCK